MQLECNRQSSKISTYLLPQTVKYTFFIVYIYLINIIII